MASHRFEEPVRRLTRDDLRVYAEAAAVADGVAGPAAEEAYTDGSNKAGNHDAGKGAPKELYVEGCIKPASEKRPGAMMAEVYAEGAVAKGVAGPATEEAYTDGPSNEGNHAHGKGAPKGPVELPVPDSMALLAPVDFNTTNVNAISPELMCKQATINIGTIGHVGLGQSRVISVMAAGGGNRKDIDVEINMNAKLGCSNVKIFKCENEDCQRPMCYMSGLIEENPHCDADGSAMKLLRHVCFIECPANDTQMAAMLHQAPILDGSLLLIAADEKFPQPEIVEQLSMIEAIGVKNILIIQNKIDLVNQSEALEQHEIIKKFIEGTIAEGAPVVPISETVKCNIDVLCEYIVQKIPVPVRDYTCNPRMHILHSGDINKPSYGNDVRGGVLQGFLLRGALGVNRAVEIRPGIVTKDETGRFNCQPIFTRVVSLSTDGNCLDFAAAGGLIKVETTMDPVLARSDRLKGHVVGIWGYLPDVFEGLEINFFLLRRLFGVDTSQKVLNLAKKEVILVNVGLVSVGAEVIDVQNNKAMLKLLKPICASVGDKIALSRRVELRWRLIGWGHIHRGMKVMIDDCIMVTYDDGSVKFPTAASRYGRRKFQ